MRKNPVIIFLFSLFILNLFVPSLSVQAEDMNSFINLTKPFISENFRFSDFTIQMAEEYVKSLPGFSCKRTNFSNRTTRIECNSDRKTYSGSYKLFFSFNDEQKIDFLEIKASHPTLDKVLSSGKFDLAYHSNALWQQITKLDFIKEREKIFFDTDLCSHVFSSPVTAISKCQRVNGNSILCLAYKTKQTNAERDMYILSISSPEFFVNW